MAQTINAMINAMVTLVGYSITGNVFVGFIQWSTAGTQNFFPAGSPSSPPAGMFSTWAACVVTSSSGSATDCALAPGATYHNNASCDNVDCGPNTSAIEAAKLEPNDSAKWGVRKH